MSYNNVTKNIYNFVMFSPLELTHIRRSARKGILARKKHRAGEPKVKGKKGLKGGPQLGRAQKLEVGDGGSRRVVLVQSAEARDLRRSGRKKKIFPKNLL
jgi:hypothetical protein